MIDKVEALKDGCDRYAEYYADIRRLLSAEYAAEVRWITASLFALNAGGLFALAGKQDLRAIQECAGGLFWLGIFFTFCYVMYSQAQTKKFLCIIQNLENAYVVAAASGYLDQTRVDHLEIAKAKISTHLAKYLAISSFFTFSLAIGLLVSNV